MAVAAPARKPAPARKAAPAPSRRKRPALAAAPARKPPARKAPARKPASPRRSPARRPGGQLVPIAVGTAAAVRKLPDSGLIVRLTQGRAWIGLLGVLLAGIVALNVITLSIAATAGQVDQNIQALDQENSILRGIDAQKSGAARIRHDAASYGLSAATIDEVGYVEADPSDVATAAQRLAAAGTAY
jgi:hypothetical protein